jgi:hypothetical protein
MDYNSGTYINIYSTYTVVILDFGKSKGVINGVKTELYDFSSIHDILCILLSSMNSVIKRKLTRDQTKKVFNLSKFFSGGPYSNNTQFTKFKQLKDFIRERKKFSNMINQPKYEMSDKTPMDFIKFIIKQMDNKNNIEYTFVYEDDVNIDDINISPIDIEYSELIYNKETFNSPDEVKDILSRVKRSEKNCMDILLYKQRILEYVSLHDVDTKYKNILSIDNIKFLQSLSSHQTFLMIYEQM